MATHYFYDPASLECAGSVTASGLPGTVPPDNSVADAPKPPPYVPPPDTRTAEEKRRAAYKKAADPIARRIDGYRLEADALYGWPATKAGRLAGRAGLPAVATTFRRSMFPSTASIPRTNS